MDSQDLRHKLREPENSLLEFKLEYMLAGQGQARQKDEIAKDVLSLVNSLTRDEGTGAYLIIGAGDTIERDGTRKWKEVKPGDYSTKQFLEIVNSRCFPPIHSIQFNIVESENQAYGVLKISPPSSIHRCSRDLETPSGKVWPKHTVLIRHGDSVGVADVDEVQKILKRIERQKQHPVQQKTRVFVVMLSGAVALLLSFMINYLTTNRAPDVTLRFVNSRAPALILINNSGSIARQLKIVPALWNLDSSQSTNPIPIPIRTFDWIRPHEKGGPTSLFSNQQTSSFKRADRIVGSIGISCPDCSRGRTFVVCITWGQSGWFAELPNIRTGEVIVPQRITKETLNNYLNIVPVNSRIPIVDY